MAEDNIDPEEANALALRHSIQLISKFLEERAETFQKNAHNLQELRSQFFLSLDETSSSTEAMRVINKVIDDSNKIEDNTRKSGITGLNELIESFQAIRLQRLQLLAPKRSKLREFFRPKK